MNILLDLSIRANVCLQFRTNAEGNNVIDLCNTVFTIWLLRPNLNPLRVHSFAVGYDLRDFYGRIEDCLEKNSMIPEELGANADLGMLRNQHFQNIVAAESEGKALDSWAWTGSSLLLFESNRERFNSCMTFLYNNEQGEITLEVSKEYPWFFGEDPPADQYISYEDWLPEYKILYKTVITRDVAENWIKQLRDLYKKMNANMPNGMGMPFDKQS